MNEHTARSSDHFDSPATQAELTADLGDHYVWIDGDDVAMVMTLYFNAPSTAKFSDAVKYVFHSASGNAYGSVNTPYDVICSFDVSQNISCWGGADTFVTGDASRPDGLISGDGNLRVFAGRRADPFTFNVPGFIGAIGSLGSNASTAAVNAAGCPSIDTNAAAALRRQLAAGPDAGPPVNPFANTLAIVVRVKKALVTKGGPVIASWVATYK